MNIVDNFSLRRYNTFNIECIAKQFSVLNALEDYTSLVNSGELNNKKVLILGGGSNVLFTDDFDGLVVHPQFKGVEVLEEDKDTIKVRVGAGEVWEDFVEQAVSNGWFGIENLALIPGLVGAAPMQNIGAYGTELKDIFDHLRAIHFKTGELTTFSKEDCGFAYRTSVFKTSLQGQYLIYDVSLNLKKVPSVNLSYKVLNDYFKHKNNLTPKDIFEAVVDIRNSKLPDPKKIGNAGSFFKNPIISKTDYEFLKAEYPDIVAYPQEDDSVKIAAGWMIEQAGYKGMRKGKVGVHHAQALVLVNYGGANGQDIFDFSKRIAELTKKMFGIVLEPEVNII